MSPRGVLRKWLIGASALWLAVAAVGVWFFIPIYLWVCNDCGTPAAGESFGPGESRIVWAPTLIAAAIAATIITLGVIGLLASLRWLRSRTRA